MANYEYGEPLIPLLDEEEEDKERSLEYQFGVSLVDLYDTQKKVDEPEEGFSGRRLLDWFGATARNIPDQAKQSWAGIKQANLENSVREFKGDAPPSWMMTGPGMGMFGASEIAVAQWERKEAFEAMPEEELQALNEDILSAYEQNYKDYEKYANQAAKRLEQFGPKAKAASGGFTSFMVQAPLLVAAAYTKNPLVAQAALPYFGMMEKGTSYMEARKSGLSHEEASTTSTINAISEVGTEGLSNFFLTRGLFKSLQGQGKNLWEKTLNVVKNGVKSTIVETGTEELNMVVQNVNGLLFDVQSELKQAYEGQNDPLYNGPTPAEVWADQAFLTMIASVVASGSNTTLAGGIILSPDIKNELLKHDPDKARVLARNLKTLIDNTEFSNLALDEAVIRLYKPETYDPNMIDPIDWMTEAYLESELEAIPGQTRTGVPLEELSEEKDVVPKIDVAADTVELIEIKSFDPSVTEINKVTSPKEVPAIDKDWADIEGFDITPIDKNLVHNNEELSLIQQLILDPRNFDLDSFLEAGPYNPDDVREFVKVYRDFEGVENSTVSKAINHLTKAGMPQEVFFDLGFIGAHGAHDFSSTSKDQPGMGQAIGMYSQNFKSLSFAQVLGLDQPNNKNATIGIANIMAHELGHHIDYGFIPDSQDYITASGKLNTASSMSPLFEIPKYKINWDPEGDNQRRLEIGKYARSPILEVVDGQMGTVFKEAYDIFATDRNHMLMISGRDNQYEHGTMLNYPLSLLHSMMLTATQLQSKANPTKQQIDTIESSLRFLKGEVFAQMHKLYYTNRPLMEEKAPETIKLIERAYNGISVDGTRNKSLGILSAFRAPGASRSVQISRPSEPTDQDQSRTPEEPARARVEGESLAEDGLDLRQPVSPAVERFLQEPEKDSYIVPVNEPRTIKNNLAGAPNQKGSKTARTLKVNKLVKYAEDPLAMIGESRYWYEEALAQVDELTRGDVELKDKVLKMLAVYSSQTPLDANIAYVLRSLVSMAQGNAPIKGFDPNSAAYAQIAMDTKGEFGAGLPGVGLKIQSFYQNLTGKDPDAVTIDSWMMDLLGYPKNAAARGAVYSYAQDIVQRATQKYNQKHDTDLTPMQMQAILWTYARNKKLESEGKSPDYGSFDKLIKRATSLVTGEVIPTPEVADLAFVENLTQDQKVELSKELLETFTTENNTFELLDLFDTTGLYSFSHSFGGYQANINPNILTRLTLEKTSEEKQFDSNDLSAADDFIRAWGYVFRQNAMPWQLADDTLVDAEVDDANNYNAFRGSDIEFSVEGQPFELTDISRAQIAATLNEQGITGWSQTSPNTINVINFDQIEGFTEKVEAALASMEVEGVVFDAEHEVKYRTQYLENNWKEQPNGEGYLENSRLNEPSIQERLNNLRAKADEVYAQYRFKAGQESRDPNSDLPATGIDLSDPAESRLPETQETKPPKDPPDQAPPKGPDENNQWTMGDEGLVNTYLQTFRTVIANNFDRVVVMQKKVEDQYGSAVEYRITDKTDVIHGKIKYNLDLAENEMDAMLGKIAARKITLEELNDFSRNLHAPERNAHINTLREPGKPGSVKYKDKGSGIHTDDAIAKLKEYGIDYINGEAIPFNEKGRALMDSFADIQKFIQGTLDIYSQDGLVEEGTVEDWASRYNYYVPLVGFASDTTANRRPSAAGGGMAIYGPEMQTAKGRTSISGPPIEQAITQRINAVVRAEKNAVAKSLADFAREFPNPEMYEVMEEAPQIKPKLTAWDSKKGEAFIGFKEDGVQKYVQIYDQRLADSFHSWGSNEMGWFVRNALGMTRFMSMMATQFNPDFIITNFSRDIQTAYYNLLAEEDMVGGRAYGVKIANKLLNPKKIARRQRQLWRAQRGKEIKDPELENIQDYYDAFGKAGAITGYIDQPTTERISKNLESLYEQHAGTWKGNIKKKSKPALELVEDINTAVENTARFSVFVEYLEALGGLETATEKQIEKAAVLAKNLTINFNRKGTLGPYLNGAYMFFNAGVQGVSNFARGFHPGKKNFSRNKAVMMGGITSIGSLMTIWSLMQSDEDEDGRLDYEKIPAHEFERNMIIMLPYDGSKKGGAYKKTKKGGLSQYYSGEKKIAIAIPLPYLYNTFHNFGRLTTEMIYGKYLLDRQIKSPAQAGLELASIFVGSASPIGLAQSSHEGIKGAIDSVVKSAVPTVAKPFHEWQINSNHFGTPVTPESFGFGPQAPQSSLRKKNTRELYISFAKWFNEFTGGNDYRSGWGDIKPDSIQHFLEYFGGGALRFGTRSYDAIERILNGQDVGSQEIPFLRVLTAEPQDWVDAKDYHNNSEEVSQLAYEYRNLKGQERKELREADWDLIRLGPYKSEVSKNAYRKTAGTSWKSTFDKAESDLKDIRAKEKRAYELWYEKDPIKYQQLLDKYAEDKNRVYQRFNKKYYLAKEKRRKG